MKNENIKPQNFCAETELLIDEHLEGMISLRDKEIMDEHIAICDNCKNYFEETESLIKKLNALPGEAVTLSGQKKADMWNKAGAKIDNDKYRNDNAANTEIISEADKNQNSFIYKYRYILSGIAAVLVLGVIVFGVKNVKLNSDRLSQQSAFGLENYWKVSNLQGNATIGGVAMSNYDSIKEGQWIQTNFDSRAELIVSNLGKVIIEPNSKVVFLKSADGNNRIMVEYGTINTNMNPNAKSFFVEMPSAIATDNGGSYTMTVDSTGDGLVYVKSGKVDVESLNRGVIIPAGNLVLTKKDFGVGTPFNENSSPKFKNALFNFDFGNCSGACVATLLNNARMSDAVTLVNLIPNVEKEYSDKVYTKLANFVSPPMNIHGDSIHFMDEIELNQWIDKIQVEVQENVERNLKDVKKNLEQLKDIERIDPEKMKGLEDFAKNWKFKIKTAPKGTYVWDADSLDLDKEQFKKDMEEMKKEIKENNMIDKVQMKEDMEQLKEDLQEMKKDLKENLNLNNEELKKEMEKANEEIRNAMKEVNKIYIPDSLGHRIKINVNSKDGFKNNVKTEEPDEPEAPQAPAKIENEDDK